MANKKSINIGKGEVAEKEKEVTMTETAGETEIGAASSHD